MKHDCCKICGASSLVFFAHTAICRDCGVLMYYPYPMDADLLLPDENTARETVLNWYSRSSFYNHSNFTNMIRYAMDESHKGRKLDILDYGGGGGQFALVCKSHFPESDVYIADINDGSLLQEWRSVNLQIPFMQFDKYEKEFDFIFLNDVFEHVSQPLAVLKQLSGKLKNEGKIFIDTPKQFWIFPLVKVFSKTLYAKILKGTVSTAHLQIWSRKAFELVVKESGLRITKYDEVSEYTMPADFYMKNMGVTNPLLRLAGRLFYKNAKWLAKNKIMCVLSRQNT